MSYSTIYVASCFLASLADCAGLIILLVNISQKKLSECWHHFLILLIPSALAVFGYFRYHRYFPYAALACLLVLSAVFAFYSIRISPKPLYKGLLHFCTAALSTASVAISAYMIALSFISPNILGHLGGGDYKVSIAFNILRFAISLYTFFGANLIYKRKTKHIIRIVAFFALALLHIFSIICALSVFEFSGNAFGETILLIILLSIAPVIYLALIYIHIHNEQKRSFDDKLLSEKKLFEEKRHSDANAVWEGVQKIRHDIRLHLTVISGYLNENETEKCKEYIATLLQSVETMGNLICSDNRVLDYLINSKLGSLENTQIVISGFVGDLSDIADADLACIIGNILDNAIEAVANTEEKRIELLFSRQNSNRIIICKNTISQSVLSTNPHLKSTKHSDSMHGYGTKIVADIVAKYHGMIDYFEEHDMFGVQILLPSPSNE